MIERAINHCDKAPNGGVTQPVLTGRQEDAPTGQMDTYVYRENNLPVDILDPSSLSVFCFFFWFFDPLSFLLLKTVVCLFFQFYSLSAFYLIIWLRLVVSRGGRAGEVKNIKT